MVITAFRDIPDRIRYDCHCQSENDGNTTCYPSSIIVKNDYLYIATIPFRIEKTWYVVFYDTSDYNSCNQNIMTIHLCDMKKAKYALAPLRRLYTQTVSPSTVKQDDIVPFLDQTIGRLHKLRVFS